MKSRQVEVRARQRAVTDLQIYLSEVLFKVTELQALLQFQVVFTPELFEGILRLIQLGKEPETHNVVTHSCTTAWIQYRPDR